jgi:hypothetical protein
MKLKAAKIENGLVTDIIVGDYNWAIEKLGGYWVDATDKTVGVGYEYTDGNFIIQNPQPFPSWTLNENNEWVAPMEYPSGENFHYWDEETLSWIEHKFE